MIVSPVTPVPVIVGVLSLVGDDGASIAGAADAVLSEVIENCDATRLPLDSVSSATSAATFTVIAP